jgi:hypothetical protein
VRPQVIVELVQVCEYLAAADAVFILVLTYYKTMVRSEGFISHQIEEVEVRVAARLILVTN